MMERTSKHFRLLQLPGLEGADTIDIDCGNGTCPTYNGKR